MRNLESGDRIELFYEDSPEATISRDRCHSSRPRACRPDNINYDLHHSKDDPDVWILYENWKAPSDLAAYFQLPYMKASLAVLPEVLEKRNGFAALFDGYEDCMKVKEKTWHASFACTNMVMPAF